jgi:hypothetical protein
MSQTMQAKEMSCFAFCGDEELLKNDGRVRGLTQKRLYDGVSPVNGYEQTKTK